MNSSTFRKLIGTASLFLVSHQSIANNVIVSNVSLASRNTASQTIRVQFNLSWENSWRTTSAPFNWDAAWVFVKYRVGTTGEWKHATLATSGHTLPGIATSTQNDATGIFIYRSAAVGSPATFNPTGIQLQWNYGSDGVTNESRIFVRVFAIEMVYNLVGGFQAGSGGANNGELRRANDVSSSTPASTFNVTGSLPTIQSNNSLSSSNNLAAYNNTSNDLSGTSTATLATGYPTGFNAFYSMKYEISQQQYVDFLNTLTYTQQAARTAASSPPNSAAGTGALISGNLNRNGIDIQTPGTASTVPAVYACNLNASNGYNEADDGQHIACNYLSWDDLDAYLDWAGLRPMTELEFEKSCRGNQAPVLNEYPWGNTSGTALTGITNASLTNELASNSGANIAFTNSFTTGPVRNGIFATNTNSRSSSGAGYYGNMELGGNLWERVVTLGNNAGRAFSGNHGNGTLNSNGDADVAGWPDAAGAGWKGGSYDSSASASRTSTRLSASNGNNARVANTGGRGVRSITTSIVINGLALWFDAGLLHSYPQTGVDWIDMSGNRNNGTLLNGPTFNSSNEGNIVLDGVNDYVNVPSESQIANSTEITAELFIKVNASTSRGWQYLLFRRNTWTSVFEGFVISLIEADRKIQFNTTPQSGSPQANAKSTTAINYGTIYHIVGTFKSNDKIQAYINGVLEATTNITHNLDIPATQTVKIGRSAESLDSPANAQIYIARIYNRVLSTAEIQQNFNAQKARFGL